jgi:hypothetical protein|tara:strand:+ start:382 stop:855 length:474 start_codon:yes stop_codon:yes gene_type:complete
VFSQKPLSFNIPPAAIAPSNEGCQVTTTVADMKQIVLMVAVAALVGSGKEEAVKQQGEAPTAPKTEVNAPVTSKTEPEEEAKNPDSAPAPVVTVTIADPIVEKAIRKSLKNPEGELTESDLEKVNDLDLRFTKITKAGVAELRKALPKCNIESNPTK